MFSLETTGATRCVSGPRPGRDSRFAWRFRPYATRAKFKVRQSIIFNSSNRKCRDGSRLWNVASFWLKMQALKNEGKPSAKRFIIEMARNIAAKKPLRWRLKSRRERSTRHDYPRALFANCKAAVIYEGSGHSHLMQADGRWVWKKNQRRAFLFR